MCKENVVLSSDGAYTTNPKEVIYIPALKVMGITMDIQDYNKCKKITTNGIYTMSGEEFEFSTDIK